MVIATLKSAIYIHPTQLELYAKTFSFLESEELSKTLYRLRFNNIIKGRLLSSSDNMGVPYYSLVKTVVKEMSKSNHHKYQG